MRPESKKIAINAIIDWVKNEIDDCYLSDVVNIYLAEIGANNPTLGGSNAIIMRRRMVVNHLMIDCIFALSRDESARADKILMEIASKLPTELLSLRGQPLRA